MLQILSANAYNAHWPDKVASKELWKKTGKQLMLEQLRGRKWSWLRHLLRRDDDSNANLT